MAMPLASSFAKNAPTKTEKATVSKVQVVKGEIVTVNTAKNEVVIKDQATGKDKTITVSSNDIGTLTVGEKVRVKFNPETNVAESVKKIVHNKKK
jgi:hypothetical protein